jgi:anthranilate phosphoribosyltransferase
LSDVSGGTPEQNAAVSRGVLTGRLGPNRDLVLLNAGAAIYVGGVAESLAAGVEKAAATIDSGAAAELLGQLIEATNSAAV